MSESTGSNWEMAIVLPLGIVTNQLLRIEAQLRLLDMKALAYAREREDGRIRAQVDARLEQMHEALDSIRRLVSDIGTDIAPAAPLPVARVPRTQADSPASARSGEPHDRPYDKPRPERDD